MLRAVSSITKAGIRDQAEMEGLISHLKTKGYPPIIRGMLVSAFAPTKLPEPDEQLITKIVSTGQRPYTARGFGGILGDIFVTDNAVLAINPIEEHFLEASAIGHEHQEDTLAKFCTDIQESIRARLDGRRVKGMEFEWKPVSHHFPRRLRGHYVPLERYEQEEGSLNEKNLRYSEPNYDTEDAKAASLLVDTNIRQIMLKLAQVGKMMSKDALALERKPDTIKELLSLNLVAEEYLLICKQDQHTICVVPSKQHLAQDPLASFRCNICGRSFPEENLQVIYTLTDKGKRLTKGSSWMSIWVTELLKAKGVKEKGIRWNLEAGGDELDIVVEDFGSRSFLELKDREFGLGDAYPFTYRITRYGGDLGVIVTMEKVSTDAKSEHKGRRWQDNRRGCVVACAQTD